MKFIPVVLFACIIFIPLISYGQITDTIFTRDFSIGDEHPEVISLQNFLNTRGFTVAEEGAGSPGNTTNYYGLRTSQAVSSFQQSYASEILAPAGVVSPTGYFGYNTRAKVNQLLTSGEISIPDSRTAMLQLITQLKAQLATLVSRLEEQVQSTVRSDDDTLVDQITDTDDDIPSTEAQDWVAPATNNDTDTPTNASGVTDTITQYGITWNFAEPVSYGTYANGDYWVQGPVIITSMSPSFTGSENGWQVNPQPGGQHGFDARVSGYSASVVPSLPYNAQPNSSIVKTVSVSKSDVNCRPCLETAAVLTVVDSVPANNGATEFRPPYIGDTKTTYSVNQINYNALPKLTPVASMKDLDWVTSRFQRVQIDHIPDWVGREVHPVENMPDYGADIARDTADGALALMFNDSNNEKSEALINYLQMGIDWYHILANGGKWSPNGGHSNGRKLPIAFTGQVLDDSEMINAIKNASEDSFSENAQVFSTNQASVPLWGSHTGNRWGESNYWQIWRENKGARTVGDWYGYIDGGELPGSVYQGCCTSQPFKGTALAIHLVPGLRSVWNDDEFLDYADRWVYFGAWTQPDPCAPYDGNASNYGITYGPDGNGGCVKDTDSSDGIGRFPELHGTNADNGSYGSSFANAVWSEYRGDLDVSSLSFPPTQPAGLTGKASDASTIRINWNDIETENGYRLERRQDGNSWVTVQNIAKNNTSITDDGLQPDTTYEYRLFATNNIGDSLPSNTISVTTLQNTEQNTSNNSAELVAYYTFDGNVRDQSGNGLDGTLQGDPEYVSGVEGNALELDGTGDYVYLGNSPTALNFTGPFSFAIWVKPNQNIGGYIFGKGAHSGGLLGQYAFSNNAVQIIDNAGLKLQVGTKLVAQEWQHIAGTWDGTTLKVYRNGALLNEASNSNMGQLGYRYTNNVHIGAERSERYFFNGLVDDMRVYDKAISSTDVSNLYNDGQVALNQTENPYGRLFQANVISSQQYINVLDGIRKALESIASYIIR